MNTAIIYAVLSELVWDIRDRLEIVLRALAILNPEEDEEGEETEPPLGLYS